jgi:antitoxin (DNA-binding transcriptional repressor) of toxin-antitoxin stability system
VRDALQVVAIAALLALAGCGAGGPAATSTPTTDDQPATTAPPPATTAPPPATTTTPPTTAAGPSTAADRPPGVSAETVTNVTALVGAHRASVVDRGATTTVEFGLNGTVDGTTVTLDGNETVVLTAGASEFRWTVRSVSVRNNESTRSVERYYANDSAVLSRVSDGENATVTVRDRAGAFDRIVRSAATKARLVNATLTSATFTVVRVDERDGRTVTTLAAVDGTYSGPRPDVVAYDARLRVTASGRVLSLTRSRTIETDRTTERFRQTITWADPTPVERPDWAANASAA